MLSGIELAKQLAATGTGKDKLTVCRSFSNAETAIQCLKDRNWFATAGKAQAIFDKHIALTPVRKPKPVEKPAPVVEKNQDKPEPAKQDKPDPKPESKD